MSIDIYHTYAKLNRYEQSAKSSVFEVPFDTERILHRLLLANGMAPFLCFLIATMHVLYFGLSLFWSVAMSLFSAFVFYFSLGSETINVTCTVTETFKRLQSQEECTKEYAIEAMQELAGQGFTMADVYCELLKERNCLKEEFEPTENFTVMGRYRIYVINFWIVTNSFINFTCVSYFLSSDCCTNLYLGIVSFLVSLTVLYIDMASLFWVDYVVRGVLCSLYNLHERDPREQNIFTVDSL